MKQTNKQIMIKCPHNISDSEVRVLYESKVMS